MRVLSISSGIAVLFTTLAYAHILHHHFFHASSDDLRSPLFWLAILLALAAGILSFIGAILLLKRPATPK
jgi:H+/Cl- antiporter ClcA